MYGSKLVAVCNLSPDSFSGDGVGYYHDRGLLTTYIQGLVDQGADMIDVGAVSTAPGAPIIDFDEEYSRLEVFFTICGDFVLPFSLDTRDARIAQYGIDAGISIINDVSGGRYDADMIPLIAANPQIKYVIMYSKTDHGAADMKPRDSDEDIVKVVCEFVEERIAYCLEQGVKCEQIILDPGMGGFVSPDPHDSVRILQSLGYIRDRFGLPIFVGTSRKGFLGKLAPDDGPHDRVGSSLGSGLYAMQQGVDYLRVHDIKETRQMMTIYNLLSTSL